MKLGLDTNISKFKETQTKGGIFSDRTDPMQSVELLEDANESVKRMRFKENYSISFHEMAQSILAKMPSDPADFSKESREP